MTFKDLYLLTYKNAQPFDGEKNMGQLMFSILLEHLINEDLRGDGSVGIIDLYCYCIYLNCIGLSDIEMSFAESSTFTEDKMYTDAILFDYFNKDELFEDCRASIEKMPKYLLKNIGLKSVRADAKKIGELTSTKSHCLFMLPTHYKKLFTDVMYGQNLEKIYFDDDPGTKLLNDIIGQIELLDNRFKLKQVLIDFIFKNLISPEDIFSARKELLEEYDSPLKEIITRKIREEMSTKVVVEVEEDNPLERIKNLDLIEGCVIGQDDAVKTIKNKLRSAYVGFRNEDQPVASFLLTGPTGVGKTETAKAVANACYDGKLFVVDMSTYKHKSDVNRLLGSAPGYVGYGDANQFCEFIKANPYSVILFDEIEKADSECLDLLMRILDEGQFINALGDVINLRNIVIFCTTNLTQNKQRGIGFGSAEAKTEELVTGEGALKKEHVGRYSNVIEYKKLTRESCKQIVKTKFIDQIIKGFKKRDKNNLEISVSDELIEAIVQDANVELLGARDLKKSIQKLMIDPISLFILENEPHDVKLLIDGSGSIVQLDIKKINKTYEDNSKTVITKPSGDDGRE